MNKFERVHDTIKKTDHHVKKYKVWPFTWDWCM